MRIHINSTDASPLNSQSSASPAAQSVLQSVAHCCRVSAAMLRLERNKHCDGQAGLLERAADYADAEDKRIHRLEADLNECAEFLEGQADVNDGDYGEPSPNRAMQLMNMIDETLHGRPY